MTLLNSVDSIGAAVHALTWLWIFVGYVALIWAAAKWIGNNESWLIQDMSDSEEDI